MHELSRPFPKPTAQVAPYVDILGADLAVDFLLRFGGAELSLSERPGGGGQVSQMIGADRESALHSHPRIGPRIRVPLAKKWLAEVLRWRGIGTAEIARTLRASDVSVRAWLRPKA